GQTNCLTTRPRLRRCPQSARRRRLPAADADAARVPRWNRAEEDSRLAAGRYQVQGVRFQSRREPPVFPRPVASRGLRRVLRARWTRPVASLGLRWVRRARWAGPAGWAEPVFQWAQPVL